MIVIDFGEIWAGSMETILMVGDAAKKKRVAAESSYPFLLNKQRGS